MGKAMSGDTSGIIVRALAQGHSRSDIAKMCGVSTRAVTRVSTNLKKHGTAKPPPSGLKQGRPAKLTRKQAEALLAWITRRDYTFYIKDLVSYLRETHDYKGCDGTIRRGMVRAGFRRKEPYHKSEITVWIPPDHPPQFEVITEDDPQPKSETQAETQILESSQHLQPDSQYTQQFGARQQPQAPPAKMTPNASNDTSMFNVYQNIYNEQPTTSLPAQAQMTPLDPSLYHMHSQHDTPQPQSQLPFQPPSLPSQSEPAAPSPSRSTKSTPRKTKKTAKEDQLQSQVSSMHEEMAKQAEIIRQLQMQLAAQNNTSGQAHDQPVARMQVTAFNDDGIDPSLEQQNSQQRRYDIHMNEEEVAV